MQEENLSGAVLSGKYRLTRKLGRLALGDMYAAERLQQGEVIVQILRTEHLAHALRSETFLANASLPPIEARPDCLVWRETARAEDGTPYHVYALSGIRRDELATLLQAQAHASGDTAGPQAQGTQGSARHGTLQSHKITLMEQRLQAPAPPPAIVNDPRERSERGVQHVYVLLLVLLAFASGFLVGYAKRGP
ncbi:MAG: hypothetical protein KBF88_17280 [Polyangiaceae bacterium]|nr:hypothetical protein [Polyangiaceae bacterium]